MDEICFVTFLPFNANQFWFEFVLFGSFYGYLFHHRFSMSLSNQTVGSSTSMINIWHVQLSRQWLGFNFGTPQEPLHSMLLAAEWRLNCFMMYLHTNYCILFSWHNHCNLTTHTYMVHNSCNYQVWVTCSPWAHASMWYGIKTAHF